MVEFKANIADPKTGRTYQITISGHSANSLLGKRIGDEFDGIFVNLPGYKVQIRGGSDKQGFPMRKDLPIARRKKILISKSTGFYTKKKGLRKRRNVWGNTITENISQINLKITSYGSKPIEQLLKVEKKEKT